MKATTNPFSFIGKLQWNIDLCLFILVRFTLDVASVLENQDDIVHASVVCLETKIRWYIHS